MLFFVFCAQKVFAQIPLTLKFVQCIVTSDYHLSKKIKKMLHGHQYVSDTEVQSVAHQRLGRQPASFFFASGVQKFVARWNKRLNEFERYV